MSPQELEQAQQEWDAAHGHELEGSYAHWAAKWAPRLLEHARDKMTVIDKWERKPGGGMEHERLISHGDALRLVAAERRACAELARSTYPRGGAHTYASENADIYIACENAAERIAAAIEARGGTA